MNHAELEESLLVYPDIIAGNSAELVKLLSEKAVLDAGIDNIETTVKFQIGTDKSLTNDTARKSAIKDLLNQNKQYDLNCREREAKNLSIENVRISHQRNRDMMNVLIAIAGMK